MGSVCAEDHGGATVAVTFMSRLVLSRIPHIKDYDGSYEVELRSSDINVRAILNEPEDLIGWNKIVCSFRSAPSSLNRFNCIACWKRLSCVNSRRSEVSDILFYSDRF